MLGRIAAKMVADNWAQNKYKRMFSALKWMGEKPVVGSISRKLYQLLFDSPQTILLHINNECNLDCVYCYLERDSESLSTSKVKSLLTEARTLDIKFVHILGGEPFLHRDIFEIIECAFLQDFTIVVYTNGTLISGDTLTKLLPYRERLHLTVNYDHPSILDTVARRKGTYERIKANVANCRKAGFPVSAVVTVTRMNVDRLEEIAKSAHDLGMYPSFERYLPVRSDEENEKLELSPDQWNHVLHFAELLAEHHDKYPVTRSLAFARGTCCNDYQDTIHVMENGEVLPCIFMPKEMTLGNVYRYSLAEIWEIFLAAREEWKKVPVACLQCPSVNICGGGCKTYCYLKTGRFDEKDPLCVGEIPPHKF